MANPTPPSDDVGPEPAAEPEQPDRPSPHSTALALLMLRALDDLTVVEMVTALNGTPVRALDNNPDWTVNHRKINDWEQGKRLRLPEAGRYANWWGIPAPVLFVFASFASDLRDDRHDLARLVAHELIEACHLIIKLSDDARPTRADLFRDAVHAARVRKVSSATRQPLSEKDRHCLHVLSRLLADYDPAAREAFRAYARNRWGKAAPATPATAVTSAATPPPSTPAPPAPPPLKKPAALQPSTAKTPPKPKHRRAPRPPGSSTRSARPRPRPK